MARCINGTEQNPEINMYIYGQLILTKTHGWSGENGVCSTIGAGATGYPYTKEWTWIHTMHYM